MLKRIFTYLVRYDGLDEFGSIKFCAESRSKTIRLFNQWCIIDSKLYELVQITSIEKVYYSEDAKEYVGRYGN